MEPPDGVSADHVEQTLRADAERSCPASMRDRVAAGIGKALADRRLPLVVAILAVVGMLPALTGGWQLDDYFQRATLLGYGDSRPINTFIQYIDRAHNLSQINFGTMPWWGSPDLHQAFLRYASTLTMMLDYRLWPNHPALMHLQSLLWLSAAVLVAALLYREVLGATWIAGLAALMYALDGAHAVPAAYLANRNALIACCFGFLSVLAFVRWRKHGGARTRWLSVLMLALALSAGEMGLATVAYLFSYALTIDRDGIRARLMRLLPHGGVLGAWASIYRLGNFGSHGSGFYLDPLRDPLGFAGSFCQRAAFLLVGQWSPLPAEMSMANAPGTTAFFHMSVFSFVVAAIVAVLFIPLVARDRVARFWGLGALLSLIPIAAVGPENRLLGFVGLGSMALLAQLTQVVFISSFVPPVSRVWKGFAWAATLLLLLTHVVAAPLLGIARIDYQANVSSRMERAMASVPSDPRIASQDLVLINPRDHIYLVTAIWTVKQLENLPMPRHLRALSSGGTLEVTRVGPRSLRVRFPGGFFPTAFSRFVRSQNDCFSPGEHFELPGLSIVVEALDAQGDPAQVLYEFPVPLEDPSLRWMRWQDGVYVPWSPPALDQTEKLPSVSGIFG
ncbi:hypothetical protein [Candidatus Binatus sp.]|uniref:hypothetical protein n=1 Tax=Candidatus Binatus sp. TaxID=2811406 RepID=UPI002F3FC9C1